MTEAGSEFYRHAVSMLQQADQAETAMRQRVVEPIGTVRFTAAVATAQFAMRDMVADFLIRYPKVNVVGHATDEAIDIVGEHYDIAIRAHSLPLPDSTLVQRPLAPAPWFLFAGSAYLDAHGSPQTPQDLAKHPSLFMMRADVVPAWRLRHPGQIKDEVVLHLAPRILSDDMVGLKQAAIAGLGIVALPAYVCRDEVRSGALRRVLPPWLAGDSTLTALIPYRQLLPCVRVFIAHLAAEFPKAVLL
jgi:DNA-binding transcriptional LysR family regulator